MAVNIGPKIGIDGEAEYRKQIQRIIQETKTLKSEYEKVTSAVDDNTSAYKKNAEEHKILNEQIDVQKQKVAELSHMVDESTQKYGENDTKTLKWKQALNEAQTELNQLQAKLKELPSNLTIFGDEMQAAGDKIKDIGKDIENLGNTLRPASMAAAGAITASVKTFMDFEGQMSRVKAISGATTEEFDALNEKAKEMGETTSFTATEAAEAFEYMGMAGWKSEQMIDGIAPIMDLAAASGEELASVSDIVTDALTAFGLEAKDAAAFADVLATTATNANTNVGMMGESFKYVGPVAGSLGYSIEDISLALGLMANNGIKADMAGTALRNLMQRMAKPTKESAAAMDRLGLSMYDDSGKMYSFREIMDQMRKSFGKINMPVEDFNKRLSEMAAALEDGTMKQKDYDKEFDELILQAYGAEAAEKARAAAMLAGARAMPGLLAIVNTAEGDYEKLATAIDHSAGAAHNMATTMLDNTKGALTLMKSAVEGAALEFGEVFSPYVVKAADSVKELANRFSALDQVQQDTIAKIAVGVAAAAPALTVIGKLTTGLGQIISSGGAIISALGSLGGPAAAGVIAIGALTGAIVAMQEEIDHINTERIESALSTALVRSDGTPLDQVFADTASQITQAASAFDTINQKASALDSATKQVSDLAFEIDKVSGALEAGVMTAEEAAPKLEELLGQLADAISTKMSAAADVLLATFADGSITQRSFESAGQDAETMRDRVYQSLDDQQKKIYDYEETLKNAQFGSDEWYEAKKGLDELKNGLTEDQKALEEFQTYVAGNPLNWEAYFNGNDFKTEQFQRDLGDLMTKGQEFSDSMVESMNNTAAAAEQLGDPKLAEDIRNGIPAAMDFAKGEVAASATATTDAIQVDLIGGIDNVIKQAEKDWENMSLIEKVFAYDNDRDAYIAGMVNKYQRDYIDPVSDEIETGMNELGVQGAGWAKDASKEITSSLFSKESTLDEETGVETVKIRLKKNWEQILDETGKAASAAATDRGKDIVDGFNNGVYNNQDTSTGTVQTWMEKIKTAIHDSAMKFGSPSKTAEDFGKDTVDGYSDGISHNEDTSFTTTTNWMDGIKKRMETGSDNVVSVFESMNESIRNTMDDARRNVSDAFDDIKRTFDNTHLKFPDIKLPHINISGEFSIDPPRAPHFSIDWYAKAMQGGMRLTDATIFGMSNGKLLGGGEAGNEWIVGEGSLMSMIRSAVRSSVGYIPEAGGNTVNIGETTIIINGAEGQDVQEIADAVDEVLTARYQQARAVWA